ncbi:hypothetical protein ACFV9C_43100 [Kribbella sp. NPDC059898]|uniref:hypothetical protein n=1 Tax=Kribbella sp. NPDC059898 TaxID=3346995 RepID=UPI0036568DFC
MRESQSSGIGSGPVWKGWFCHVPAETRADYKRFISEVHRHDIEAQKQAGLILDYKFVTSRYRSPQDWNFAILLQLENMAALDRPDEEFGRIEKENRTKLLTDRPELAEMLKDKDQWRVSIGQRLFREMVWGQ